MNGKIVDKPISPKAVGYRPFLYSYHELFQTDNRHEMESNFFQKVDGKCKPIMDKLLSNQKLTEQERVIWAYFLLVFRVRSPESVQRIKDDWLKHLAEGSSDEQKKTNAWSSQEDFSSWLPSGRDKEPGYVESLAVAQIPDIAKSDRALKDLLSFRWCVIHREGQGRALILSDRPLVWTPLQREDCVLALPLSPTHLFLAFPKNSIVEKSILQRTPRNIVETVNRLVVSQADEYVFTENVRDVEPRFIRNHLSEKPRGS